ncbi:MAG: hypothetical protein CSA68_05400 [Rhodobacterales bacterium]|nr:MAG: hypothetical protein CSA68_05400 [Rhodobacterales bacterium]
MSKEPDIKGEKPKKRRNRARRGLWFVVKLLLFLLVVGIGLFVVSGKTVTAPQWVQSRIAAEINAILPQGDVRFRDVDLRFDDHFRPQIGLHDVVLKNAKDHEVARIGTLSTALSVVALLRGQFHASEIRLNGTSVGLKRAQNGQFDLGFGSGATGSDPAMEPPQISSLAQLLDQVSHRFEMPALAAVKLFEINELTVNYVDSRARRGWFFSGGQVRLSQENGKIDMGLSFALEAGVEATSVAFNLTTEQGDAAAVFGASLRHVSAQDLASQIPALAWLAPLDAPISGAMRVAIGQDGNLGDMNGTLEIGQGFVQPTEDARAIAFTSGRAYFGFDPAQQKIRFDELSVISDAGSVLAEGHAYLRELTNQVPAVVLGQLRILQGRMHPKGVFANPVEISGGAADIRLRLDPFELRIGQAVVQDGDYSYQIKGNIRADNTGWHVGLDAKADRLDPDRLLAFWPVDVVPNTRKWLSKNVLSAKIFNVNGALRVDSGQPPVTALGFEFADTTVRFMKHLPPVTNGSGHASIVDNQFIVVADRGQVTASEGGVMEAAGTVFTIHDLKTKGPPATIALKAKGPIHAALSLLDQKPFLLMSKAEQPVDLAQGRVEVEGEIKLGLLKKIKPQDVEYQVNAVLHDVHSDKLLKGRVLQAERLALTADRKQLQISGTGRLGQVPVQGQWHQKMGPEFKGVSQLKGSVELSQRFVDEFALGLPPGSVSGAGSGQVTLDLRRGQGAKFDLTSDLSQLGLRVPELGWSLSRSRKGKLEVSGVLGQQPRVDRLVLQGAGLSATGKVDLTASGGLRTARFSRVRLGGWLDAPVTLTGRGKGVSPAIAVNGGTIDTRKASFGSGGGKTGGRGAGPLTVALDRLIVSKGIVLNGFKGKFSRKSGLRGTFQARLNGRAAITGIVAPTRAGSAYRIKSKDAGAVLRAAGVIQKAQKGTMDLTLVPRKGAVGQYNGRLEGRNVRVRGAHALADLLSAISGVGLLEQLNGKGILFSDYQVRFRLTPYQVVITSGSAVGPSMGVSMSGVYNLGSATMDVRGVLSPIYFLNGLGQIFTRKREGLFGFNYRMSGPADDPKVGVNPLSIFTPGMFRDLFKRPPPKVLQ